jgi:hypothetical protein
MPDSQQLVNILGSLVAQLSASHPTILEDLVQNFEADKARVKGKTLQITQLERVLVKHISRVDAAFILVDALDESEDFSRTVASVMRLLQQLPNLKILATSTRNAEHAGVGNWPHLVTVSMLPGEDISIFVESTFSTHFVLRGLSVESRHAVKTALATKADGS